MGSRMRPDSSVPFWINLEQVWGPYGYQKSWFRYVFHSVVDFGLSAIGRAQMLQNRGLEGFLAALGAAGRSWDHPEGVVVRLGGGLEP